MLPNKKQKLNPVMVNANKRLLASNNSSDMVTAHQGSDKLVDRTIKTNIEPQPDESFKRGWDAVLYSRYNRRNCKQMMINMWNLTGSGRKEDIFDGINASLEFLMSHHLLQRDLSKRKLELSDAIYTVENSWNGSYPMLGFRPAHRMILTANDEPLRFAACRNKEVEMCLVSAFAFSLWYRFDFEDAPLAGTRLPDFLSKKKWHPIKVLFSNSQNSLDNNLVFDKYEMKLMKKCLESIGLKPTTLARPAKKSDSHNGDAYEVVMAHLREGSHWLDQVHFTPCMAPYPYDFIHFSGGFKEHERYHIPRDVAVPIELQELIFPWLEGWIEKVQSRTDQEEMLLTQKDGAVLQFLQMLGKFRAIIVQDLAVRMGRSPHSIFCQHPITRHPTFRPFQNRVNLAIELCPGSVV